MRGLACVLLLTCIAPWAAAQSYPTKPIRVVVVSPPGGVVDTATRILSTNLSERLGWQFTVDNRPGANGFLSVAAVQKAAPDGHTLLMAHVGEFAINPAVLKNVPYDLERDFIPITMVSDAPLLYLASSKAPFSSFQELIAVAKAKPGEIAYSSVGAGSVNHLAVVWLALKADIKLLHVPYKGGAAAATAIATGEVPFGTASAVAARAYVQSGRAKVIGVTTAKRSMLDPSWPTPADEGVPDVDASMWLGLFARKGVSQSIIDRLNSEVRHTLESADVRARFDKMGSPAVSMSSADFLSRIKKDAERYKAVVKAAGIKQQ